MKRHFPEETNLGYADVKSQKLHHMILVYLPVRILTAYCINNNKTIKIIQFNLSFINVLFNPFQPSDAMWRHCTGKG
jgi:hypothetical protein